MKIRQVRINYLRYTFSVYVINVNQINKFHSSFIPKIYFQLSRTSCLAGIGYYLEETKGEVGVAEQINVNENFKNSNRECIAGPSNIQVAEVSEAKDKISSKFPGA